MNPYPCEDHKYIHQIYSCANQQPEITICLPTPQTVSYFRQFFLFFYIFVQYMLIKQLTNVSGRIHHKKYHI